MKVWRAVSKMRDQEGMGMDEERGVNSNRGCKKLGERERERMGDETRLVDSRLLVVEFKLCSLGAFTCTCKSLPL